MDNRATWMYGLPRYSQTYTDEVDKIYYSRAESCKDIISRD